MRHNKIQYISKIIFWNIVTFATLILFLIIICAIMEHTGYSENKNKSYYKVKKMLYETDYYGESLKYDPYAKVTSFYLHPFYLFSLPWLKEDIQEANNKYVTINQDGFRRSYVDKNVNKNAILLGGSAAFSHFAKSDETSLGYLLSMKSKYNFINRNAPGWVSGQEFSSLIRVREKYDLSISFSLYNDVIIACELSPQKEMLFSLKEPIPQAFHELLKIKKNEIEDNEKGLINTLASLLENFFPGFRNFLAKQFPETKKLFVGIILSKSLNIQNTETTDEYCKGKEDLIFESFIHNQKIMRLYSNSIGAEHFLIIQPVLELNKKNNTDNKYKFYKKLINRILENEFCKKNCFDYSAIFLNTQIPLLLKTDDESTSQAIFIDNVHLSSAGLNLTAQKIINDLNK